MKLYVGTSGYSYKEWKGPFYPEDLSAEKMLRYYATRLPAVEINNTFYRLPRENVLRSWAEQVPEDFRFVLKASQKITHFKRLKDVGEETEYLLRTACVLGERLGVILFQLPPNLKKDIARLKSFLSLLPDTMQFAFEFRHSSWFEDDAIALLAGQNCALCIADSDDDLEVPLLRTATWGYLRLRREGYTTAGLRKWMRAVESQSWERAFVFFKHEDEATGPRLAEQFLALSSDGEVKSQKTPVKKKS
jgi:uncharacterized protein YecE (DUF72 family)